MIKNVHKVIFISYQFQKKAKADFKNLVRLHSGLATGYGRWTSGPRGQSNQTWDLCSLPPLRANRRLAPLSVVSSSAGARLQHLSATSNKPSKWLPLGLKHIHIERCKGVGRRARPQCPTFDRKWLTLVWGKSLSLQVPSLNNFMNISAQRQVQNTLYSISTEIHSDELFLLYRLLCIIKT